MKEVKVNIYADEIISKNCPFTKNIWHYIGIIVEDIENPLLEDIKNERFYNNFDLNSPYFKKNNRIIHWSEINDIDTKDICKRWFEYILDIGKSEKKFYSYVLGINDSNLIKEEFDLKEIFNSKYNRFFRSAILYAIKNFFPNNKVIVKNIFHEVGQQSEHSYFPWHCIYKIREDNISFECNKIIFLPKDHKCDDRSNLIQLCDAFMGSIVSIIHGIKESKRSKYREELMDLILPLVKRMIKEPENKNSRYKHANRIMIRFFPKKRIESKDIRRKMNQFFTKRELYYLAQKSGQQCMFKNQYYK